MPQIIGRQNLLRGQELLLLFLADVVQVFLPHLGKAAQPAAGSHVASGQVGEQLVHFLVLAHGVARVFGGFGVAHDGRPQGLFLGRRVALDFQHQFLEQLLAIG
ncbi:hypothetical protein SDC9_163065 [bioreactor metagenome]|uniref:Uncharacterized protein n=1 Tax=bioreactor metagenome TaxID=1076179 RepID=A0A645FMV4_9ZZZZ